ncbi:hypothetical protein FI667_g15398, partial [Globisporangium splendens]
MIFLRITADQWLQLRTFEEWLWLVLGEPNRDDKCSKSKREKQSDRVSQHTICGHKALDLIPVQSACHVATCIEGELLQDATKDLTGSKEDQAEDANAQSNVEGTHLCTNQSLSARVEEHIETHEVLSANRRQWTDGNIVRKQSGNEVKAKSTHVSKKEDHREQTQPTVEAVQVGDAVLNMEAKHGDCTDNRTHKPKRMQRQMDTLVSIMVERQRNDRVPIEHAAVTVRPREPRQILLRDYAADIHVLRETRAHPDPHEYEDEERQTL